MTAVLVFTAAYTVALFVYGRAIDSPLANLYIGISLGLVVLFGLLNIWAKWSVRSLWAISLVGLGNMLGGVLLIEGQPLYMTPVLGPVYYDKVFHALAAGAMALIAWEAMRRWAGTGYHEGGLILFTWLVVMGGGAVVEIAELIGSSLSDVSVGDYTNNALDLVANAIGGAIGLALVVWWERRVSEAAAVPDANLRL